jgi:hemerythrin-like domain-containing protein
MNPVSRLVMRRNKVATSILAALMIHGRKGKSGLAPDFDWLAGMLEYVERVVRGQHYRDEEACILRPLEKQALELRPKLARMRRDHIGSGGYCVRMAEALSNWKRGWAGGVDMYVDNARDHYRLSAQHGLLLRRTILPAAEKFFTEAQWRSAALSYAQSEDPVARSQERTEYEAALCRRMGRRAPPQVAARLDPGQGGGLGGKASVARLIQEV